METGLTLWPRTFAPELFAGILLDQNCERDVFEVWVGNQHELEGLAHAFEDMYKCTVLRHPGILTVCCPTADCPSN